MTGLAPGIDCVCLQVSEKLQEWSKSLGGARPWTLTHWVRIDSRALAEPQARSRTACARTRKLWRSFQRPSPRTRVPDTARRRPSEPLPLLIVSMLAGLNPISIVTELRLQHAQGNKYAGVNVRKVRIVPNNRSAVTRYRKRFLVGGGEVLVPPRCCRGCWRGGSLACEGATMFVSPGDHQQHAGRERGAAAPGVSIRPEVPKTKFVFPAACVVPPEGVPPQPRHGMRPDDPQDRRHRERLRPQTLSVLPWRSLSHSAASCSRSAACLPSRTQL